MQNKLFNKGSEWRIWDLHIHTPASFHWNGTKFQGDPLDPVNYPLVDEMINALNSAEPAVLAIMDYWTFDGWFALQNRLLQTNSPKLNKTVFPGIELRIMAPMEGRLNAHVIFSNIISKQDLIDFKSKLTLALINKPLSDDALRKIAREASSEKLRHHGFNKQTIDDSDEIALKVGCHIAEITPESYKNAIDQISNSLAIGYIPFDTNDGLNEINRNDYYAYVFTLFNSSPIFETRKLDLWAAFSGIKTPENEKWFLPFQTALNNRPRLAISGSDAHKFVGVKGDNDNRGYGDFPSDKITWIKADPTFDGLLQAIKEPAKRSFIGKTPQKLNIINANKNNFITKIQIATNSKADYSDSWLDGTDIDLNSDLVAIIGNKGSGKSALADIIALLGNSKQSNYFSFLKENRFRGKTGEPAKYFDAKLIWQDGFEQSLNLNSKPLTDSVELVKYIPQGYFEELCNAHVSGQSNLFEKELRSVIFSHTDDSVRLGALNFDEMISKQEQSFNNRLNGYRNDLHLINKQIEEVETKLESALRSSVEELIKQQERLLDDHEKSKPDTVSEPVDIPNEDQILIRGKLDSLLCRRNTLESETTLSAKRIMKNASERQLIANILEGYALVEKSLESFFAQFKNDAELLNIDLRSYVNISFQKQDIIEKDTFLQLDTTSANKCINDNTKIIAELTTEVEALSNKLNRQAREYAAYQEQMTVWTNKKNLLVGSKAQPESLIGLKEQLNQIDKLPDIRNELLEKRLDLSQNIYNVLIEMRNNRDELFKPVQSIIQSNSLIREEYKLNFHTELYSTENQIADKLFSLIKQSSGELRGESESISLIKDILDNNDLNNVRTFKSFITSLYDKLEKVTRKNQGLSSLLRKNSSVIEVYNFLFGLEYLNPRYTLTFQGSMIGQLSPGQRGALLLIFYLLVDKGNNPIILDQPEENLDNETIVSLLVPILTEAKEKRQIIMVTHNPNLAVVCDAEQIIHCEFDRSNTNKITYTSGAIECKNINGKVINVLEGTMPAFNNRKIKYQN